MAKGARSGGLTFANVVSVIALFVALGGSAYAVTLPRNSVGTAQLRRHAVTRSKIRDGAVGSSQVKDRSLRITDFMAGQLPAGPKGDAGPTGATGATGGTGPRGPAGATNVVVRTVSLANAQPDVHTVLTVDCHPGERAVGGGATYAGVFTGTEQIVDTAPTMGVGVGFPQEGDVPTGWFTAIRYSSNNMAERRTVVGYAVCVSP